VDSVPTPPEGSPTPVVEPEVVHVAAMSDRINEICQEIHNVKHGAAASAAHSLPLSRRLMLQALPLRDDAIRAHIERTVLAEQQALTQVMLNCGTPGPAEVPVAVDIIGNYRSEAAREIELASHQMADALLARCLIEACADLADVVDLEALLGSRK
jgi:hypothetical protein